MFGREQKAERYRRLRNAYRQTSADLDILRRELDILPPPADELDALLRDLSIGYTKNHLFPWLTDPQKPDTVSETERYAARRLRLLSLPLIGNLAAIGENHPYRKALLEVYEFQHVTNSEMIGRAIDYINGEKQRPTMRLFSS